MTSAVVIIERPGSGLRRGRRKPLPESGFTLLGRDVLDDEALELESFRSTLRAWPRCLSLPPTRVP